MKYVARPREYRLPGMHTVGHISDGQMIKGEPMPLPDLVEIELEDGKQACMMFRYTKSGDFCGDTWHEDLEAAFYQAEREYGLTASDFLVIHDVDANDSTAGAA